MLHVQVQLRKGTGVVFRGPAPDKWDDAVGDRQEVHCGDSCIAGVWLEGSGRKEKLSIHRSICYPWT